MKRAIFTLILLLLFPSGAFPHGVYGSCRTYSRVFCVEARYTTGDVMSYAEVKVLSPKLKIPFQIGRTDANGVFCFLPDSPGVWRVRVEDGMGHLLRMNVEVSGASMKSAGGKARPRKIGYRAVLGIIFVVIIFWALSFPLRKRG